MVDLSGETGQTGGGQDVELRVRSGLLALYKRRADVKARIQIEVGTLLRARRCIL